MIQLSSRFQGKLKFADRLQIDPEKILESMLRGMLIYLKYE